jgi:hypothetical protein
MFKNLDSGFWTSFSSQFSIYKWLKNAKLHVSSAPWNTVKGIGAGTFLVLIFGTYQAYIQGVQ